ILWSQSAPPGLPLSSKTRRKLLLTLFSGREDVRSEACPISGCSYKATRLDGHVSTLMELTREGTEVRFGGGRTGLDGGGRKGARNEAQKRTVAALDTRIDRLTQDLRDLEKRYRMLKKRAAAGSVAEGEQEEGKQPGAGPSGTQEEEKPAFLASPFRRAAMECSAGAGRGHAVLVMKRGRNHRAQLHVQQNLLDLEPRQLLHLSVLHESQL
ncbi:hypothetical protein JZ751_010769, partial [Albula glossodonta]